MSSDEFDSSSTLYECIAFSKICFGYILSSIGKLSLKMNNDGIKLSNNQIISNNVENAWYICDTRVKSRL